MMAETDIYEDFVRHSKNYIICEHCGAKRHFLTYRVGDISFKHYEICPCLDKRHQSNYNKHIGVFYDSLKDLCFAGSGYRECSLNNFIAKVGQENAYDHILRFTESFIKDPQNTKGVILSGGVGCGKTHLMCGALNHLIEKITPDETIKLRLMRGMYELARAQSCPYRYFRVYDLANNMIQASFKGDDAFFKKLINVPLLAIDDLGCEMPNQSFISRLLYVIDGRMVLKRPVIITTNLLPDEILKKYGSRIYDRLKFMCDFVPICADSKR